MVCLLIARWPPLTSGTSAVVIVAGGLVVVAGLRAVPRVPGAGLPAAGLPHPRVTRRQWLPWLVLGVAFCLWELALLLLGNNDAWPPLSRLADPLDQLGLGRFTLALVWLLLGWWLLRLRRGASR